MPEASGPTQREPRPEDAARSAAGAVADSASVVSLPDLLVALDELAARHEPAEALRAGLLTVLRHALAGGHAEVLRRFTAGGTGEACVRATACYVDRIIEALAEFTVTRVFPMARPTVAEHLCIAAVGGYGRGELAPFSDIDLLFLLPYKRTPRVEQVVEYILYVLWDLGLKVGHAVRSVDESIRQAKADVTIRTSLLEARFLCGERTLFQSLKRRFAKEIVAGTGLAFAEAKLAERDARHLRMGDSRYVLEPNVKDGKGGLRDLQTLFWIAKYLYQVDDVADLVARGVLLPEEAQRFAKAQNFLWTTRCHLHYLADRPEERLTFDVQAEIGRRLGYTDHAGTLGVERFMKHYFLVAKDVGDLTRIFCAALEADAKRPPRLSLLRAALFKKEIDGFARDGQWLTVHQPRQFKDQPIDMIRLFRVAQANDLDIHPHALRELTRSLGAIGPKLRADGEANRLFLEILTAARNPEVTLRRMNEAGVLGRFLPDFGRVVAQMQYDMYHVYTVDEHTLHAIGILHRIEQGALAAELPLASAVMQTIGSRRALYLALLLHDVAKGRGGDHSVVGAKIALKLGHRLGLSEEETETAAWLVRWHLVLPSAAFKRDIEDDQTIRDVVDLIQSPERLRLLLLLTTADINAVGPGRWNNWKATLLADLFHRTEETMSGGLNVEARDRRVKAAQDAARALLPDWTDALFDEQAARGYPAYWLSFDATAHAHHARLVRDAERDGAPLTINSRIDRDRAVTEVTIYTADHAGLFSQLAGALALSGANIVDARIFTMTNGMALDVFSIQDASGGPFDRDDRLAVLVERTLSGRIRLLEELARRRPALASRTRVFTVSPRVLIDNKASTGHTVVEVNGRDRPGLLHDLTRALTGVALQISSAKISTYGEKVVDVFYVKDVFGLKIDHPAKLAQIREALLAALAEPDAPAAEAAAAAARAERGAARRGPPSRRARQPADAAGE